MTQALRWKTREIFEERYDDEQVYITIPDIGYGQIDISLVSMAAHSSMIISIFSFKQMLYSMLYPNKSSLITMRPLIEYKNGKSDEQDKKETNIKWWRRVCIMCWILFSMFGGIFAWWFLRVDMEEKSDAFVIGMWIHWLLGLPLLMTGLCLVISNNSQAVKIAIILVVFMIILVFYGLCFLETTRVIPFGLILLFAVTFNYSKVVRILHLFHIQSYHIVH